MTASAPAVAKDPYRELVEWIHEHCSLGDPIQDEAYRCGLSAIVHRLLKFGHEDAVNRLSARDALSCCLMCGGLSAEFFIRTAFTRGLIEDDRELVQRILESPFIPESRLWLAKLMAAVTGDEKTLAEGAEWLETMVGEERAIASLLIGRIFPHLADCEWLEACPLDYPRLAAEIALLLLKQEGREAVVRRYLREHPEVRFSVDDGRWPTGV